ncbi:MAG: tRNA (adenosine(37)-N6)-threonylcarbamoyltransferase complex ATPase subunit type 1 TsaE [Acidobacteria bacterium]|nr:tRNA (adenosine(37)-N6)-threonylcarbamoyltransferase complex ATPase subunit type 1 TsaE [Acidobacteriota bacterium]
MKTVSKSPAETKSIAARLARQTVKKGAGTGARVIALEGELGAGKTTFVQGFVRALGIREKVKSPTFLLIKSYKLKAKNFSFLYHIDCYRVNNWKELAPLEIRHILASTENIVLVEWPERIKAILPKKKILVHLDHLGPKKRRIIIK